MAILLCGYLGAGLFALSGLPLAWETYKAGKTDMSLYGILLILGGSLFMFLFELLTSHKLPSLLDFAFNTFCWGIILKYKVRPLPKP